MRKIDSIIIHCTATLPHQDVTVADIDRWHKTRGFDCIGYHYVVDTDGTIYRGRDIDLMGAHCKGHNRYSVGVAYIGGLDSNGNPADTRTLQQRSALCELIYSIRLLFGLDLPVFGHHDFNPYKACPCYDVHREY